MLGGKVVAVTWKEKIIAAIGLKHYLMLVIVADTFQTKFVGY